MQNIFLFFSGQTQYISFFLVKGKIYWKMTKSKHYTIYFFDHSAWKYMFLGFIIGSQVEINFRFQRCFFLWAPFAKTTSTSPQNCCSSCQVLLYSILCLIFFHQIQHEPDTPYSQPLSNIHANANISTQPNTTHYFQGIHWEPERPPYSQDYRSFLAFYYEKFFHTLRRG